MSRSKGNGGGDSAATTWPVTVFEGGKREGPEMREAVVWFYRSVIVVLLGILVYTFQKTDRKVDDLTNRVPAVEAGLQAVKDRQAEQSKQLGLIVDWIRLQPQPRGKH